MNRGDGLNSVTCEGGLFKDSAVNGAAELIVGGRNGQDFDTIVDGVYAFDTLDGGFSVVFEG